MVVILVARVVALASLSLSVDLVLVLVCVIIIPFLIYCHLALFSADKLTQLQRILKPEAILF